MQRLLTAPHALAAEEVSRVLAVDLKSGLREKQIDEQRHRFGANVVVRQRRRPAAKILASQFASIIVLLLAVAAAIAFFTRDRAEGFAILVVLLINAAVGFITEFQAERALDKLRLQTQAVAHVIRDGVHREIDASELVVGDVISVSAGAQIPADTRLAESVGLQVEEAALTGESVPVEKSTAPVDAQAPLAERSSMAYLGTIATAGRATGIVTSVGDQTELGAIGKLLAGVADEPTPLERRLAALGRRLVYLVLAVAAIVTLSGWWRGDPLWEMVEIGISLAVAAVPEGLPAVTTLILAVGVLRMARRHAIVRRLPAVETLGSTTVICTDKTGTLTQNRLTVRVVDSPDPDRLLRVGALCSEATVSDGAFIGDPTETALLAAAAERGIDVEAVRQSHPKTGEEPFDPETRRMITMHADGITRLKGAPAVVLDMCDRFLDESGSEHPMTDAKRSALSERNHEMASQALRVLGFGEAHTEPSPRLRGEGGRRPDEGASNDGPSPAPSGHLLPASRGEGSAYLFLGFTGMIDPPREGAAAAIARAREAGVRVVMLTGDQPQTAAAIARELHIAGDDEPVVVHARELQQEDSSRLRSTDVFARVSPADKLHIVEDLREAGEIVAVTGDGVNDAPALRRADIGVAMGLSGTDVARQAADLVLTDDNLATIVDAIEQGRTIYANIIRFVHLMFSHNLGEVLLVFTAIASGMPLPLMPLQLLWMNVVTDVFPAFALAMEPSAPERMHRKPRSTSDFLSPSFMILIAWQGAMLAAIALASYAWALKAYGPGAHARTIALTAMIAVQVGHLFNCRSRVASAIRGLARAPFIWGATIAVVALQLAAVNVTWLARILGSTPLTRLDWTIAAACVIAPIIIVEIQKAFVRSMRSPLTTPHP